MILRNRSLSAFVRTLAALCCLIAGVGGPTTPASALPQESKPPPDPLAAFAPAFSAGTFEEIDGKILVRVKLNDSLETRLLLDSGIWNSLLTPEAARALNISLPTSDAVGKIKQAAFGKAVLTDIRVLRDTGVTLSNWNQTHPAAAVSGVLGLETLERHALGLDFTSHTYGLWPGGKIPPAGAQRFNSVVCASSTTPPVLIPPGASLRWSSGSTVLTNPEMRRTTPQVFPMERTGSDERYHLQIKLNEKPVKVFLDTGAARLSLTDSIATTVAARPYREGRSADGSVPPTVDPDQFYVRTFRMGSFEKRVNFVAVIHRSLEDRTDTRLSVNSETFAHCRVVLDFPGHTLYLSPYDSAHSAAVGRQGLAGLFDQGLFVPIGEPKPNWTLRIGRGSPAEKAGLKDGDELRAVGGKATTTLASLPERREASQEPKPLQVTIHRRGAFDKQVFTLTGNYDVYVPTNIYFSDDPAPFPDEWLKPPISVQASYLDPVRDRDEITRAQRLIREELTRYSPAMLQQNLHDVYVVASLSEEGTEVGGLNSPDDKKLYLEDNNIYDEQTEQYLRLAVHHELAHVLLENYAARFSRELWQSLNAPSFRYGKGGLAAIREDPDSSAELDPACWEEGFAYPYGKSDIDEDFACLAEAVFAGNSDFWKAVDRVAILNKKVKMVVAFYHSLDPNLTEAYFRQLKPFPSATDPLLAQKHRYGYQVGEDFASGFSAGRAAASLLLGVFLVGGSVLVVFLVSSSVKNSRSTRSRPQGVSPWLNTNLWYVVMQNDVVGTENALTRGADVDFCDTNGNPLLVMALLGRHLGPARLLLNARPDPNLASRQNGITPLMAASSVGATDVVEMLLAAGALLDMQSYEGACALGYAAYGGYPEIVSMLLVRGANPHLADRHSTTALIAAQRQLEATADPSRRANLVRVLEMLKPS